MTRISTDSTPKLGRSDTKKTAEAIAKRLEKALAKKVEQKKAEAAQEKLRQTKTDTFVAATKSTPVPEFDGKTPAPGTTGANVALPANPPFTNAPGERSAKAYDEAIDQFAVGNNSRYRIRDTSGDGVADTFCNIFASDVASAMGVPLPHWVNGDGSPAKAFAPGARELSANATNSWLNTSGARYGWKEVTPEEAQRMANLGMPVVASQAVNPIGHIGVVRPGEFSATRGPALAQAGATNTNNARAYDFFTPGKVQFFVNTTGGAPADGGTTPPTTPPGVDVSAQVPQVDLQRGAQGPEVEQLQRSLVTLGYMTDAQVATGPGIFGPRTQSAVAAFQRDHGVSPAAGNFGPLTRAALTQALQAKQPTAPVAPNVGGTDVAKLDALLANSGLRGQGATIAALAKKYDVPVELGLAMLWHEGKWNTAGRTPSWNNPGNLRFTGNPEMQPGAFNDGGFAHFPDVKTGLEAYFRLLDVGYRKFIDQKDWAGLVHKYAPAFDGNDERRYVEVLEQLMPMYRQKLK